MSSVVYKKFDRFPGLEFLEAEQGTSDWYQERLGSVGSSEVKAAFAGGQGKTRSTLMRRKVREQYTGEQEEHIETFDMRWGIEIEPEARNYFSDATGLDVVQTGLVRNEKYPGFHASPDGLIIRNEGVYWLEIKCPKFSTCLEYMEAWAKNKTWTHPTEYKQQTRHHSIITGAVGGFFVSYFPEGKARDLLGDDSEWAQIITFVPQPTDKEVKEHTENMQRWTSDYEAMSPMAEQLTRKYRQEQQAKKDEQLNIISSAKARTDELIKRIS